MADEDEGVAGRGEIGEAVVTGAAERALADDLARGAGMKDEGIDAAGAEPRREAGKDEAVAAGVGSPGTELEFAL